MLSGLSSKPRTRPWVRYWARYLDLFFFAFIMELILYAFSLEIEWFSLQRMIYTFALYAAWIPLETVLLAMIGTTPAKWMMGIKVLHQDGSRMSWGTAFKRSLYVWMRGQGAALPIVSFLANLNGYQDLKHDKLQTTWDRDLQLVVSYRPSSWWSETIIYILIALLIYDRWLYPFME